MGRTLLRASRQVLDASILNALILDATIANGKLATNPLARANHTGTQAQSTIVDLVSDLALKAPLASPNFSGTPQVGGANLATQSYVNTQIGTATLGVGKRGRVRCATTANITIATALNNGDSLDGLTLATGELVLVKNQTDPAENGVYEVGASPARSSEYDSFDEHPGSVIGVTEGTANADTLWFCTSNAGGTLGATAIAFTALTVSGSLMAVNNLSDLANAATAFSNIKQAATESATGVVELATTAEALAGTDTTRSVTAAGLKAHLDGRIITHETPSGTIDSTTGSDGNGTFALANTPLAGSVEVYVNGIRMDPGSGNDYQMSGSNVVFESGAYPLAGSPADKLRVSYIKA